MTCHCPSCTRYRKPRQAVTQPITDHKGREVVSTMTERQLLEEMVSTIRRVEDTVVSFVDSMSNNPMMATLSKMFNRK